jgi:hypothetical protein
MDIATTALWVAAGAAVIYTIATFCLWWATLKTHRAMRDAFRLNFLLACREATRTTVFPADLMGRMTQQAELLKRVFPKEADLILAAMREQSAKTPN